MARDHIFISYATEDLALAEWLTLRLTAEGYEVWCDRIQLLGGESYPIDIDRAMRERAFRVVALISRHSAAKANPLKERTLALNLGRERGEDFLIPLNVDGLTPSELPLDVQDLTYVPFHRGWASGLFQLLQKFYQLDAPQPLPRLPTRVSRYLNDRARPSERRERLWSNVLELEGLPPSLLRVTLERPLSAFPLANWPHYEEGPRIIWAIEGLPELDLDVVDIEVVGIPMSDPVRSGTRGPNPRHVLTALLKDHLRIRCIERGLRLSPAGDYLYFPSGIVPGNRLTFIGHDGEPTWIAPVGERQVRLRNGNVERFRHHLAVEFRPDLSRYGAPVVQLRVRLYLSDQTGHQLHGRKLIPRRKRVTRDWWNHQWLMRQFAALSWISQGRDNLDLTRSIDPPLRMRARPIVLTAEVGINESELVPAVLADEVTVIDEDELALTDLREEAVGG